MREIVDNNYEIDEIFSDENYKLVFTSVRRGFEGEVLEAAKLEGHSGAIVMQAKAVEKVRKIYGKLNEYSTTERKSQKT